MSADRERPPYTTPLIEPVTSPPPELEIRVYRVPGKDRLAGFLKIRPGAELHLVLAEVQQIVDEKKLELEEATRRPR